MATGPLASWPQTWRSMMATEQENGRLVAARPSRLSRNTLSPPHSAPLPGRKPARNNGFTLVEALTVIALTLIVGAIAVPTTATIARSYRLRAAATQLGLDIIRARTMAIARSTEVRLVFRPEGYFMERLDVATGSWFRTGGFVALPSALTLVADKTTLEFASTGITTGNQIVLSNGESSKVVEVTRLGQVTVT